MGRRQGTRSLGRDGRRGAQQVKPFFWDVFIGTDASETFPLQDADSKQVGPLDYSALPSRRRPVGDALVPISATLPSGDNPSSVEPSQAGSGSSPQPAALTDAHASNSTEPQGPRSIAALTTSEGSDLASSKPFRATLPVLDEVVSNVPKYPGEPEIGTEDAFNRVLDITKSQASPPLSDIAAGFLQPAAEFGVELPHAEPSTTMPVAPPDSVHPASAPLGATTWEQWLLRVREEAERIESHRPLAELGGLWIDISPRDRATLLGRAKKRLATRHLPDPFDDHPNPHPPHLYSPQLQEGTAKPVPAWLNIATGTTSERVDIAAVRLKGLKCEVMTIDNMLVSLGHTMDRLRLPSGLRVPLDVDRKSIMPASLYKKWLAPTAWQNHDKSDPIFVADFNQHQAIDLLATPQEIAEASPWGSSELIEHLRSEAGTIDRRNEIGVWREHVGFSRMHLSLVERKAVLLSVLRGVAHGQQLEDKVLWVGRPWIDEFRTYGLFVHDAVALEKAVSPVFLAARLAVDVVCRLLEPEGGYLLDRFEAASKALAGITPEGAVKRVADGGPDDPAFRVQVIGRAVRPMDAVLTEEDRKRLFARHPPVSGSASDPCFQLPVGAVIVLPDSEPAYIRGRGWSTMANGRLHAINAIGEKFDRVMPFHLPTPLRAAALKIGPTPETGFSPGPRAIYYRGYRWVLRRGGGARRWDETEGQGVGRVERVTKRTYAEIENGRGGTSAHNPFRLPGRPNMWPFGLASGDGLTPDEIRVFFGLTNVFHLEAFGPTLEQQEAWPAPLPVAFRGSWDRSWENKVDFGRRWARASIPPEVLDTAPFRKLLGMECDPLDQRTIREVLSEARLKCDSESARILKEAQDDGIYQSNNRKLLTSTRERLEYLRMIREQEQQASAKWDADEVTRHHRQRGREISAESHKIELDRLQLTCRLAYIPDPEVDGSAAKIEIVEYDPAYRPEPIVWDQRPTPLLSHPPVDHESGPIIDAVLTKGPSHYRHSEKEQYLPFAMGTAAELLEHMRSRSGDR